MVRFRSGVGSAAMSAVAVVITVAACSGPTPGSAGPTSPAGTASGEGGASSSAAAEPAPSVTSTATGTPTTTPAPSTTTEVPPSTTTGPLPAQLLVADADGLGPARIGQPVTRFAAALGRTLTAPGASESDACFYREAAGLDGVAFMVLDDVDGPVRRVDVDSKVVRTTKGLGVGSTRAQVKAAYPAAVTQPHEYVPGAVYLVVHAGEHDLLFETDAKGVVTRYRFGDPDPVSWVEGCA